MTNCFLRNKRGFTLIEMMVVVAIMGIIAAIGIPQYLQYRRTAIFSSLQADLDNIKRAFTTCISAKTFGECASITDLRINNLNQGMNNMDSEVAIAPFFCADIERTISGVNYNLCTSTNAITGNSTTTYNSRFCYTDGGVMGMACPDNNGDMVIQTPGDNSFEADCDTVSAAQPCDDAAGFAGNANQYCIDIYNVDGCAPADMKGECNTANGFCT